MSKSPTQINTISQIQSLLDNESVSKSYKIRELYHTHKFSKSHISTMLDIRYQHVRNVLLQQLKKNV